MFQSDAGRTACTRPYGAAAWPLVIERQRLPRKVFRRSIALLSDSLSTLRSADYSNATQDSLPVAGQALLDGILTRKVPMKGFKVVNYISFPLPKLSWRNRCNLGEFGRRAILSGLLSWNTPPAVQRNSCNRCAPSMHRSHRCGPRQWPYIFDSRNGFVDVVVSPTSMRRPCCARTFVAVGGSCRINKR